MTGREHRIWVGVAIVAAIAKLHPEAVRQQDAEHKTPLHYALERKPQVVVGVVEALLSVGLGAAHETSRARRTPQVLAVRMEAFRARYERRLP